MGALRDTSVQRRAYNLLWLGEHVAGQTLVGGGLRGLRDRLGETIARDRQPHPICEVERVRGLDPDTFRDRYLNPGIPVVLEGAAADWRAVREWTPRYFAEHYGDTPVQLINAGIEDVEDVDADDYSPAGGVTTLGAVVEQMERGGRDYPRFVPLLHAHPELREHFDRNWLHQLRGPLSFETMFQFFMGGAGTNTALHCAIPNNLFVQVHGEKEWWIYPPSDTPLFRPPTLRATYFMSPVDVSEPEFAGGSGWHTVLNPGDILYNPPFYWHQVFNRTATIGVGMRWFGVPNILRSSKTQTLLTLLSANPPIWRARQNRTNFVRNFVESKPGAARG